MADETKEKIIIDVQTNADEAAKDVNNLSASITKTVDSTEKATKANKELNKTKEDAAKATKSQSDALGELDNATGGVIESVKGLAQSFKVLLANPVVLVVTAIVGALALLYKAFTSTDAGAESMERAMAGISATIDVLRDRVLKVGGAIAKFFSGDFKGALSDARAAVSGIGEEISREFAQAAEATRVLQELEDTMRDLSVSRAKLNRDLVQSRELLQDENASYAEKKKALREVGQAEQTQTALELDAAKKKLAAMKAIDEQSDISDEKRDAQAELQKQIFGLQEESARNQIKLNKQNAALDREERARKKAIADERKKELEEQKKLEEEEYKRKQEALKKQNDLEKASLDNIDAAAKQNELNRLSAQDAELQKIRDSYAEKLKAAEKFGQDTAELEEAQANELNEINLKYQQIAYDNEKAADDARLQAKKDNQQRLVDLGSQLIANVQSLAGKNKAIQRAAIIADGGVALGKAVANTSEAVTKDLAKGAPFSAPLVALDLAVGATSIASIISGTSKALAAVGGGGAPSAPSLQSAPGGVNASAQVGFQASNENQIATSISNSQQALPPIKTFVVASDVKDQQTLDAKLVSENSFGGSD